MKYTTLFIVVVLLCSSSCKKEKKNVVCNIYNLEGNHKAIKDTAGSYNCIITVTSETTLSVTGNLPGYPPLATKIFNLEKVSNGNTVFHSHQVTTNTDPRYPSQVTDDVTLTYNCDRKTIDYVLDETYSGFTFKVALTFSSN